MCLAPKMPKIDLKDPAPPPPSPEDSAAQSQGSPEIEGQRYRKTSHRNRLRIDRKTNEPKRQRGLFNLL